LSTSRAMRALGSKPNLLDNLIRLGLSVARIGGLFRGRDRVDVRCGRLDGDFDAIATRTVLESLDQIPNAFGSLDLRDVIQRPQPLAGFSRIHIDRRFYLSRCYEHRRIRFTEEFCIRHRLCCSLIGGG
jgi:hypothetical protein